MTDIKQKLLDYSELDPGTRCRLWQKRCNRDGYGQTWYQDRAWYAHRLSYQVFVGPIPKGLYVLHSCNTPACINPEHLRVGTHKVNMADMVRAGRSASGEANPSAKLTAENVRNIRQKYSSGEGTQAEIAAPFGVSRHLISYIVNGKLWKESASL